MLVQSRFSRGSLTEFECHSTPPPFGLDVEIENSRKKLLARFGGSPDLVFLRAWGNLGDELIYAGTRQLLTGLDYREACIRELQNVTGHTALIAGSGGWCKPFHDMPSLLPLVEERFESVIVLPSTFDASEETVASALTKTSALVFARELESYRQIQSLCRADIAHDCAFFFDYEKYKQRGRGVLNAFRTDAESQGAPLPDDNIDISVVCSSLEEWLRTLSGYEVVRTDRAHVMIAAAMLGKRVEYKSSNYHKVTAIARYALKGRAVCRIPEFIAPNPAVSRAEGLPATVCFAHFLAERCGAPRLVVMDDATSLHSSLEYAKNDVVLVRDGILSLERCPALVGALKSLCQTVQKVILADDIHSFPDTKVAEAFLQQHNLPVEFFGYANGVHKNIGTVALLSRSKPPLPLNAPEGFRVIALVSSYNEEDVIVPMIEQLHENGVDVYLIDNWSTDSTYSRAQSLLGRGLIGLERFPPAGPSATYDWEELLKRKEALSLELKADWFIHHDADEIHESPWQGLRLRDAIYWVDQEGCNAIDFTLLAFPPVDDGCRSDSPLTERFLHCEFGSKEEGQFFLTRAWKAAVGPAALSESGGHNVEFPGRRLYPYKFLLLHFPIRSQAHGEKKLFHERQRRWNPAERKRGWHIQYNQFVPGARFVKNPKALIEFNANFHADYLLERLSGIGIIPTEIARIEALQTHAAERERLVQSLSARIETLSSEVQTRSTEVQTLSSEVQTRSTEVQTLSVELAAINRSRAWKMALAFRGIRMRLVPPKSRRARLLRRLGQMVNWQGLAEK